MRQMLVVGGLFILVAGCGPTHYRNALYPSYGQAEFDKDWYECRRENTHQAAGVIGKYGYAGPEVDEYMVKACMAARGWRPQAQQSEDSAAAAQYNRGWLEKLEKENKEINKCLAQYTKPGSRELDECRRKIGN